MRSLPSFAVVLLLAAAAAAQTPRPVAPAQVRLLVLNKGEATASILDAGTREEVALVAVGDGPHEVAVSPDGRTAVVCNYGGQQPGSTLTVIDIAAGKALRTIDLLQDAEATGDLAGKRYLRPHGIAFLADGRRVVVTSETQRRLLVVDVERGEVVRAIPTAQDTLHMVALAGDQRTAYGASIRDGTLGVFDLASDRPAPARVIATGHGAEGVAVRPGTGEVWVANRQADTLSIFDAAKGQVAVELPASGFPIRVVFTPDGLYALVSCAEAGCVQVFAARTRKLEGTIELRRDATESSPLPVGLRVAPDGKQVWVACTRGGFLAVVDLETRTVVARVPARREPDGMAFAVLPAVQRAGVEDVLVRLRAAVPERELAVQAVQADFAADGGSLLLATADGVTRTDLDRGGSVSWGEAQGAVTAMAVSRDRHVVLSARTAVYLLEPSLQRVERTVHAHDLWSFVFAAVADDGSYLVTAERQGIVPGSGRLRVFGREGDEPKEVPIDDRWGVRAAVHHGGARRLAVLCGGGRTEVYQLPGGEPLAKLDYYYQETDEQGTRGGWSPTAICFDATGDVLFMGDSRGFLRAYDLTHQRELARWRGGGPVASLEPAAGGALLAATDAAGQLQLWDVGAASMGRLVPFTAPMPGRLVFAPDGRRFAIVTADRVQLYK